MSYTKALDNVVEQNRLSIGEFCRHDDILWIEGQQAAAELERLKAELEEVHKSKLPFKQMPCGHTTRYLVSTHEGIDRCVLCDSERLRAERDAMREAAEAAELEEAELEEAEELMKDIVNSSLCYLEVSILKDTTEWLNKHSKEK